ncbi:Dihydrofolate reductase and methyltransferase [Planctomycetales bacterium 10988]|nr:Dihydrofolate reductase and methyltransferase [Planctomycetales bacterium 10988]
MNPTCYVFIATSLDGFIARKDGNIDWLESAPAGDPDEDYGYKMLFDSVDALIMGRNTFEKVLSFPQWPYDRKPLIVLSKRLDTLPPSLPSSVRLMCDDPKKLLERLTAEGMQSFYVDGGAVIQSFLRANLIDEMTITTIPILIGGGIPLFGFLDTDIQLELMTSQSFPNGFVITKYRIAK